MYLPTKLSVLLKTIFFISLKTTKITSKIPISLGHVGHVTYNFINMLFISTGIFDDKVRPQILSVGTTANATSKHHVLTLWRKFDTLKKMSKKEENSYTVPLKPHFLTLWSKIDTFKQNAQRGNPPEESFNLCNIYLCMVHSFF